MMQNKLERHVAWIQWFIIIIFTGMCVSLCFNNNIWTDEAFTMQLLQQDFAGIIKGTASDVHPPLYYLIAKIFQFVFGPSLLVQKTASILPVTALLLFGAVKIKNLFGNQASVIFMLLLSVLPCTFEHAVQPRMYTWGLLFVTVCGVYAYDAYQESGKIKWAIVLFAGTAAAYTHYFALVSTAYIYGFLLLAILVKKRREIKKWLLLIVLSVVLYIPWLMVWVEQLLKVAEEYIIPEITWKTIWSYVEFVFRTSTPYSTVLLLVLFVIAAFGLVISIKKHKETEEWFALACLIVPIGTITAGVVLSYLIRPIFNDRYMFPSVGLLVLGFAIAVKQLKTPVLICLCSFLLSTGIVRYQDIYQEEYHSTKEPETTRFFAENLGDNDIIIYNFKKFGFIYELYFSKDILKYIDKTDFTEDYDTIWFMDSHNYPELDADLLERNHWNKEFVGMYGLEHNVFELYKMTRHQG